MHIIIIGKRFKTSMLGQLTRADSTYETVSRLTFARVTWVLVNTLRVSRTWVV